MCCQIPTPARMHPPNLFLTAVSLRCVCAVVEPNKLTRRRLVRGTRDNKSKNYLPKLCLARSARASSEACRTCEELLPIAMDNSRSPAAPNLVSARAASPCIFPLHWLCSAMTICGRHRTSPSSTRPTAATKRRLASASPRTLARKARLGPSRGHCSESGVPGAQRSTQGLPQHLSQAHRPCPHHNARVVEVRRRAPSHRRN